MGTVAAAQQGSTLRIHHAPHECAVRTACREVCSDQCRDGETVLAQHGQVDIDGELQRVLDRKSTRLNSSHSQILYAVFCLKKKNFSNTVQLLPVDNKGVTHNAMIDKAPGYRVVFADNMASDMHILAQALDFATSNTSYNTQ